MTDSRSSRQWRKLRASFAARLPLPCARCGAMVSLSDTWDLGHAVDRALGGADDAVWPEHRRCNRSAGGHLAVELRHEAAQAAAGHGVTVGGRIVRGYPGVRPVTGSTWLRPSRDW
jgi:hypothetical protein